MAEIVKIERKIAGREEITLVLELDQEKNITKGQIIAIGSLKFLQLVQRWRPLLSGALAGVPLPKPEDTGSMLLREVLLKAKGQWQPPYAQEQICHCRAISTAKVEEAILIGARTAERVTRLTSASSACGTCQPDVKAMIAYMTQSETKANLSDSNQQNKKVA